MDDILWENNAAFSLRIFLYYFFSLDQKRFPIYIIMLVFFISNNYQSNNPIFRLCSASTTSTLLRVSFIPHQTTFFSMLCF